MQATVLSIAGSDPSGGAGIQADLKTMTSIGVYGAAVITCVTVQNSHDVVRIECLPSDLVQQQIEAVLDDHHVTHIKIGMVGSISTAEAICTALRDFAGEVIYDPVMVSTTGRPLFKEEKHQYPDVILACATVLTPNIPELAQLLNTRIDNPQDVLQQAEVVLEKYNRLRAVLVKGGHAIREREIVDSFLWTENGVVRSISASHAAIQTHNTHGTGCTLAAAFASFHCLNGNYEGAFRQSIAYVQILLNKSAGRKIVKNPEGRGGMLHYTFKPTG